MSDGEALAGGFVQETRPVRTDSAPQARALSAAQEARLIHFVDQKLLSVSRMYKNRAVEDGENAVASRALDQLVSELLVVCQVLSQVPEKSGAIAVAYLLTITDTTVDYIRVFEPSPGTTFHLLSQLDTLFTRLLRADQVSVTEQTRLAALIGRVRDVVYSRYKDLEQYEASCSSVFEGTLNII